MMRVSWQTLEHDGLSVEAQIFSPAVDTSEVVLLCPGFPGAGASRFEQRHAATIVHEGYALAVLRHAGTRFDSPTAPFMINNAHRLMVARQKNQTLLGDAPGTIEGWLREPLPALHALSERYSRIHVIGNSFGALSALWSLTTPSAPLNRVATLILLAGAQGISDGTPLDIMRIWQPQFMMLPTVTDKVSLESPARAYQTLADVYAQLPERVKASLPEHIPLRYLVVQNDEILRPSDTERFQAAIGGRGEVVLDTIDHARPAHELMAHDMPDYPTEYIIDLLQKISPGGGLASVPPGWDKKPEEKKKS
ncbi:MAG: hypothetical protein H6865_07935 [Rhodospirillales bacterium]|nr:hypothetical protein [Alphaproteobacteria bacterium]MCB9987545.1 hypothetical protein [Rhodospirillales bacterium]USO07733.1 MAG: hypothetical protein H6866_00415 [Rhodospirillales bacterium]